jgi:hypothetical protein
VVRRRDRRVRVAAPSTRLSRFGSCVAPRVLFGRSSTQRPLVAAPHGAVEGPVVRHGRPAQDRNGTRTSSVSRGPSRPCLAVNARPVRPCAGAFLMSAAGLPRPRGRPAAEH